MTRLEGLVVGMSESFPLILLPLVELLSNGLVLPWYNFLQSVSILPLILNGGWLNMTYSFVLPELVHGVLHGLDLPDPSFPFLNLPDISHLSDSHLIDGLKILGPDLMYNIGTAGLTPLLFLLKEPKLPRLAKLLKIIVEVPIIQTPGGHGSMT